jgi:endoglucanase
MKPITLAISCTFALACGSATENPGPDATPTIDADAGHPLPALPLRTDSRWIIDHNGQRFKLASINWYGAESSDYTVAGLDFADLDTIARSIRSLGFNSVRLPFSNEMVEQNPLVAAARLSKNPQLQGKRALEVFDAVIHALAHQGLVVVLDNHVSKAGWCCTETDDNGLWFNAQYPEASWIADWRTMVDRYANEPAVVGVDLRNEPRRSNGKAPTWGTPVGGDAALDWRAAAQRAGNAVLGRNANLLIVVEGLNYAADLTGVFNAPIELAVPGRLVYAAHDYVFYHNGLASASALHTDLGNKWGYIIAQGKPYTAPVWVNEFGTCHTASDCVASSSGAGLWFDSLRQYLVNGDMDWAYWALNGTQSTGDTRTLGAEDSYGILNSQWSTDKSPALTSVLRQLQITTQHP